MSVTGRAAEVMHRAIKTSCADGCPYPDCCYSDGLDPYRVQALSAAGLLVSDLAAHRPPPPALPPGWSWHTYRGVLVIRQNGVSVGWVALSDHVPFTAQLANRIVRDLAADAEGSGHPLVQD